MLLLPPPGPRRVALRRPPRRLFAAGGAAGDPFAELCGRRCGRGCRPYSNVRSCAGCGPAAPLPLGLPRGAPKKDVAAAYRRLAIWDGGR
eukprot:gene33595-19252_t